MTPPQPQRPSVDTLCAAFIEQLKKYLDQETLVEIIKLNAQHPDHCATHEYCDPTQCLIDAWDSIGLPLDIQDDQMMSLSQQAWRKAKDGHFDLPAEVVQEALRPTPPRPDLQDTLNMALTYMEFPERVDSSELAARLQQLGARTLQATPQPPQAHPEP